MVDIIELFVANEPLDELADIARPLPGPESETPAPAGAMTLRTVEGWTMYDDGATDWIRAIDLAERAGMSRPRDIKRTVEGLADDGAALVVGNGQEAFSSENGGARAARATIPVRGAMILAERIRVANGDHGGTQEVTELYLNQEAVCLVAMRLRTPKAVQIQCEFAHVFVLAMKGRLKVAAEPTGFSSNELQIIMEANRRVYAEESQRTAEHLQKAFQAALESVERQTMALVGRVVLAPSEPPARPLPDVQPSPGSDVSRENAARLVVVEAAPVRPPRRSFLTLIRVMCMSIKKDLQRAKVLQNKEFRSCSNCVDDKQIVRVFARRHWINRAPDRRPLDRHGRAVQRGRGPHWRYRSPRPGRFGVDRRGINR